MNKILVALGCVFLTNCAVNNAEPISENWRGDSYYRTAVVYGVPIKSYRYGWYVEFSEYDADSQKPTGSCFGSNHYFDISQSKNKNLLIKDGIQYNILMVPSGDYAWGDKNLYIKVGDEPIYLGNFSENTESIPRDYDMEMAKKSLEKFHISSDGLQQADYILRDDTSRGGFTLCVP